VGHGLTDSGQRGGVHSQLRGWDGSRFLAKCADSHSYTNCDANSHSYSGTERHTHCHTNIYAEASPDSKATPDSTAEALEVSCLEGNDQ
jgi:hypothetical protein